MSRRFAAIDCGTNAIRLLIAEVSHNELVEIDRRMLTVRLGEGIDATGEFSPAALERTFAAVDDYAAQIKRSGVEALRMVATSASRDAGNAEVFVAGVRSRLGIDPEVITGSEEAELSFVGAVRGLPSSLLSSPLLVADIGGGSTELVLGDAQARTISSRYSMNIGCVRMTERHLHSDPPTRDEVRASVESIDRALDVALAEVPVGQVASFVGLAGSVTTIAALAHQLPAYDATAIHGSITTMAQVDAVTADLVAMTRAQRAAEPVMHPGRVDVIAGGALVLRQLMRRLPVDEVIAGESDLLDGIVYSLAGEVP
ncbi:MAG TPA: Ppx/GppA phosphatase family protein [Candidatus Nanopelagicales bacterium]|nr:Ppx/GppA phosphatase family protein [Candidatus Nanopelagicales bacterium]